MPFMSDDFQTVSSIFLDVLLVHYEMHQGNTPNGYQYVLTLCA